MYKYFNVDTIHQIKLIWIIHSEMDALGLLAQNLYQIQILKWMLK